MNLLSDSEKARAREDTGLPLITDAGAKSWQAALTAAGGKTMFLTRDWVLTGSDGEVPDNTKIVSAGGSITLGEAGRIAFIFGHNCSVEGVLFTGFGIEKPPVISDIGILVPAGAKDPRVIDCKFTNFSGNPIKIYDLGEGAIIERCGFYENKGTSDISDLTAEIYVAGGGKNIRVMNCSAAAHTDPTKRKSLFLFTAAFGRGILNDVRAHFNDVDGYFRGGFGATEEVPIASFRSGFVDFSHNTIRNSGGSAIKFTNVTYYKANFCFIDGYEKYGGENKGSLCGGILANGGGGGEIIGCTIVSKFARATDCLRVITIRDEDVTSSRTPNYTDAPLVRSMFNISDNQCYRGRHGVYIGDGVSDVTVNDNKTMDCLIGLRFAGTSAYPIRNVTARGNHARRSAVPTDSNTGIMADFVEKGEFEYISDGFICSGASFKNCSDLSVSSKIRNCGRDTQGMRGLVIKSCKDSIFRGSSRGNTGAPIHFAADTKTINSGVHIDMEIDGEPTGISLETLDATCTFSERMREDGGPLWPINCANKIYIPPHKKNIQLSINAKTGINYINEISGVPNGQRVVLYAGTTGATINHNNAKIQMQEGANISLSGFGTAGRSTVQLRSTGTNMMEIQ